MVSACRAVKPSDGVRKHIHVPVEIADNALATLGDEPVSGFLKNFGVELIAGKDDVVDVGDRPGDSGWSASIASRSSALSVR